MRTLIIILTITIFSSCSERPSTNKKIDFETTINTTELEPSIFFHEDDYCQVQITLNENQTSLQKEAGEVLGFSKEHFGGSGFTDIKVREEEIILAKKEFELLYLLALKPGRVFLRNEILNQVWGNDVIVGDRTIDVHIRKIRQKLGVDCITTVKGVGYKFEL